MTQFYFAFGSNMSLHRIRARLPGAERIGVAELKGHRLDFDMLSLDGSGKCTIHPSDEESVYGVVWQLSDHEQGILHDIEGPRYDIETRTVTLIDSNEQVQVFCYIANTLDKVALPFDWYVQHVYYGAREAQLPEHYVNAIKTRASVEDLNRERHLRETQMYNKEQK